MTRELTRRLGLAGDTLALLWLALSMAWAAVIFLTDLPAWLLTIWIATTLGPLTAVRNNQHHPAGTPAEITHEGADR